MSGTLSHLLSNNEAPPVPQTDPVSSMLTALSVASEFEIAARDFKLVESMNAAFSDAAGLKQVSLFVRGKHGAHLFLDRGRPVPLSAQTLGRAPEGAEVVACGAVEILVHCLDNPVAQNLAALLVANAAELFESREREEKLMEEVAADWESLDALCDISTDIFTSTSMTECIYWLIKRLGFLKEGFDGALFLQETEEIGNLVTSDGGSEIVPVAQLGPLIRVLKERKTTVLNGISPGFLAAGKDICWQAARCLAAVPMLSRDSVRGVVVVWSNSPDKHIDTSFQHLIDALGNRVAMLLECDALTESVRNTELLEQELEIASTIQNTLLCGDVPKEFQGVTFAALSIPSRTIGGDFYDFYQQSKGTMDILIGDVMGKGVAAALLGTAVKNEFTRAVVSQVSAAESEHSHPDRIVQQVSKKLNNRLIELERFVTLCYARLSTSKKLLEYVDCGHTTTIVHRRKTLESFVLQGQSLPLGIDVKDMPQQDSFHFEPGDMFLFYSDGATENVDPSGELFGIDRLTECVEQWSSCGPDVLLDQLCRLALKHSGKPHFADDYTAVAVRISLDQAAPKQVVKASFPRNLSELEPVREWLTATSGLVGRDGLPEDDITRLLLICIEAFDNCVIHGEANVVDPQVHLEAEIFEDSIRVTFLHAGPKFDPFHAAPPSFDGSRDNGFGLYIMVRSSDDFVYRHEPAGINKLTFSVLERKS